jgi:hypothetical protein
VAQENLPERYRLISVRCTYGSEAPEVIPKDVQIVIEYPDLLDDGYLGMEETLAEEEWSGPLIDRIRLQWPIPTVGIEFRQRAVPLE